MRATTLLFGSGFSLAALAHVSPAAADNPIIQHIYTADPAPMVSGDTVYVCTSHDEDVTVGGFFTMNDWAVFSSRDMVNWTDHGTPLSWETFSWASANKSWAPQCVERSGKFYFYVPVSDAIGVAVADSPLGPFEDAIGAPLMNGYQYIDPTVYVDDDGQAYLYFGNPRLWYVRLNEDMISYSGDIEQIPETTQSFGVRQGDADRPTRYEEGPWFYKRNDLYYMIYSTGPLPEDIGYSTAPGPTGPFTYQGIIMPNESGHAFTNHAGTIDFKGRSYLFYHTQELPEGGGYKRSTALEEFTYNADGTIPTIPKTSEGVTDSVEPLIPYYRVEGETMAWGEGVEVEDSSDGGRNLSHLEDGDWVKVESVDFLTGAIDFEASVASDGSGGSIEVRLDAVDGMLLGSCTVAPTGGWQMWEMTSCDVGDVSGVHDLYLVFTGGDGFLFNIDYWQFNPVDPLPVGTGGGAGTGGAAPGSGGALSGTGGSTGGGVNGVGGGTVVPGAGGALGVTDPTGTGGAPPEGTGGEDPVGCSCVTAPRRRPVPWAWLLAGATVVAGRLRTRWRV